MSIDLLLAKKNRDKLGELNDRFRRGEITSYVVVCVGVDGTTQVDFDMAHAADVSVANKLGGGLLSAVQHLRSLAVELKMRLTPLRSVH